MTRQNEFRIDIQVLRGIALLSVVCFHAFEGIFPNGYLGVDVFFLISGFVITPQIIDVFAGNSGRADRLKTFYIRRFYRLIPALGAMVGILTPATSTPGLGSLYAHLRRGWARPGPCPCP